MTPTTDIHFDTNQQANAIARWEDEGGASKSSSPAKQSAANKDSTDRSAVRHRHGPMIGPKQEKSHATYSVVRR
jgi:hypothetical protein